MIPETSNTFIGIPVRKEWQYKSILFPRRRLFVDVKSPQQITADRLILAFAVHPSTSSKWQ